MKELSFDQMEKVNGGRDFGDFVNQVFVCDVAIAGLGAAWGSLAGPVGAWLGGLAAGSACNYFW